MKVAILSAFLAFALAATAAAATNRTDRLRARETHLVRTIEHAKQTLRWFEKHPRVVYAKNPRVKKRAWHVIAVARQRVILGRAELARVQALLNQPRSVYEQAREEALRLGVSTGEWSGCIVPIISHENDEPPSSWDTTKDYGGGHGNVYEAYGLPQANPGHKMSSAGPRWRTDAATQVRWMVRYVRSRYGGPCQAWAYKRAHGSY